MSWALTWIGHAGFKLVTTCPDSEEARVIFFDPWFECPTCPSEEKAPEKADVICISHGHFDHSSSATELSNRTGGAIIASYELGTLMETQGAANIRKMNKGGTIELDFCWITMVTADHSGSGGTTAGYYAGDPVGFVVRFKNGAPAVYHAGDTNVFGDMRIISDLYSPKVALLPIGGNFTMGPTEAAYAVTKLLTSLTHVVPMHYGTFPLLSGTPEALRSEIERFGGHQPEIAALALGETLRLS